jgi:hypothetical protein
MTAPKEKVGLLILAAVLTFLPLVLALMFQIWPPAAMVQETFTINYVALPLMRLTSQPYHLIPVGHFSILLLSYPPSIVAQVIAGTQSQFWQFNLFSLLWYTWTGLLTFGLLCVVAISRLPLAARLGLVLLPSASSILDHSTNLGLFISYDKAEGLLYPLLAFLLLRRLYGQLQVGWGTTILAAIGAACSFDNKWTLSTITIPLFFVAALPTALNLRSIILRTIGFTITFVLTVGVVYLAFFLGRVAYLIWAIQTMVQLYQSDWVAQFAPPIVAEITRFLDLQSFYIGFQIELIATVLSLAVVSVVLVTRRRRWFTIVLLALVPAVLTFGYLFYRRTTQSTVAEFIMFMGFACSIGIGSAAVEAVRRRSSVWRFASLVTLSLVVGAYLVNLASYDELGVLGRIRANSERARAINAIYDAHPELPVHFYLAGLDWQYQSEIFPDAALYMYLQLPGDQPGGYRQTYFPRAQFETVAKGVQPGPQILVVPEAFDIPPALLGIKVVDVFDTTPAFHELRDVSTCQAFQFDEVQDRKHIVNFYMYRTRATVCVVQ